MGILAWLFRTQRPRVELFRRASRRSGQGKRHTRQFHEEQGWRLRGNALHGYYRTRYGAFKGRIENAFGKKPKYFLIKPPGALLDGPHGACFQEKGKDTFEVHWIAGRRPKDVNAGIMRLEHYLLEVLS